MDMPMIFISIRYGHAHYSDVYYTHILIIRTSILYGNYYCKDIQIIGITLIYGYQYYMDVPVIVMSRISLL